MEIDDATKRRIGQAIVYLMGVKQIRQNDVANHIGCTTHAVHRVIYGDLRSDRVTNALCELMGYTNRKQLETVALEAQKASRELILGKEVTHV